VPAYSTFIAETETIVGVGPVAIVEGEGNSPHLTLPGEIGLVDLSVSSPLYQSDGSTSD